MGVSGIFFDDAGQDFGVTITRLISAVDYVHNHTETLTVFVNAWDPDDVLSGTTPLTRGDWYLAESHPISGGQCIDLDFWWAKSQKLAQYRNQLGVRVATINSGNAGPTTTTTSTYWTNYPPFQPALWSNYLFGFDGFGFTNPEYSSHLTHANHLRPLPAHPYIGTLYRNSPT